MNSIDCVESHRHENDQRQPGQELRRELARLRLGGQQIPAHDPADGLREMAAEAKEADNDP